ncbi:uncharacterized protein [Pyrus communis]|uniref:uncharacterized protein n=1 Tax=Pyrus communis TaxID=23211 RepID=UPI0035BF6AC6
MSFEDQLSALMQSQLSFQQQTQTSIQNTQASIKKLETQVGQLASAFHERENSQFPSQFMLNPKGTQEHVKSVMTLRNSRVIGDKVNDPVHVDDSEVIEDENMSKSMKMDTITAPKVVGQTRAAVSHGFPSLVMNSKSSPSSSMKAYVPPIPYPRRLKISSYAKFLKDLCTNKRKFEEHEKLGMGELKPTSVTLQLANKLVKYPQGIIEDVLAQVDRFVLPVDFIILDIEDDPTPSRDLPLVMGHPFMATTGTIINMKKGLLIMTVQDIIVELKIFEATKSHSDAHVLFRVDVFDHLVNSEFVTSNYKDHFEAYLNVPHEEFKLQSEVLKGSPFKFEELRNKVYKRVAYTRKRPRCSIIVPSFRRNLNQLLPAVADKDDRAVADGDNGDDIAVADDG